MFQFYVIYPLAFIITKAFSKRQWIRNVNIILYVVFFLSLAYYCVPQISEANKFFLLPARLFEFTIGGIIALNTYHIKKQEYRIKSVMGGGAFVIAFVMHKFRFRDKPNPTVDDCVCCFCILNK